MFYHTLTWIAISQMTKQAEKIKALPFVLDTDPVLKQYHLQKFILKQKRTQMFLRTATYI